MRKAWILAVLVLAGCDPTPEMAVSDLRLCDRALALARTAADTNLIRGMRPRDSALTHSCGTYFDFASAARTP